MHAPCEVDKHWDQMGLALHAKAVCTQLIKCRRLVALEKGD